MGYISGRTPFETFTAFVSCLPFSTASRTLPVSANPAPDLPLPCAAYTSGPFVTGSSCTYRKMVQLPKMEDRTTKEWLLGSYDYVSC